LTGGTGFIVEVTKDLDLGVKVVLGGLGNGIDNGSMRMGSGRTAWDGLAALSLSVVIKKNLNQTSLIMLTWELNCLIIIWSNFIPCQNQNKLEN
jgi:hypothetical protein